MELLRNILQTIRPIQLLKTVLVVLWGSYCSLDNNFPSDLRTTGVCLAAVCLWSGFYALNDRSDFAADVSTRVKRSRPYASGKLSEMQIVSISFIAITLALFLLGLTSYGLALIGGILVINQFAYNVEPFRLKNREILDIFSGAVITNSLRFALGYYAFAPVVSPPFFALATIVFLKVGAYLEYRLHDQPSEEVKRRGTSYWLGRRMTSTIAIVMFVASLSCMFIYMYLTKMDWNIFVLLVVFYCIVGVGFIFLKNRFPVLPLWLQTIMMSSADKRGEG